MTMTAIPAPTIAQWLARSLDAKDAPRANALVRFALDHDAAIDVVRARLSEIVALGVDDDLLVALHRRAGGTATWRALGERLRARGVIGRASRATSCR